MWSVLKQERCLFDLQTFVMNIDLNSEDEVEQLRASVDFLVELCDTVSPVGGNLVTSSYELTYVTPGLYVNLFGALFFCRWKRLILQTGHTKLWTSF